MYILCFFYSLIHLFLPLYFNNYLTEIIGINSEPVIANREALLKTNGNAHVFIIVEDDFPLENDGILGRPFLSNENAIIDVKNRAIVFKGKKIQKGPVYHANTNEKRL